ncbi:MAG: YraN family protein [Spirochaetaceae bacterium]|jgi:putative endonuclease|nr:YraN family protein [Spirochaetaceae bacterium]
MSGKAGRQARGREGEERAGRFLRDKGLRILAQNYRTRTGEIDIIALDGETLVFAEVKTWPALDFSDLEQGIDRKKQRRIIETAKYFLASHREYNGMEVRFDVLFLDILDIKHIESAFLE